MPRLPITTVLAASLVAALAFAPPAGARGGGRQRGAAAGASSRARARALRAAAAASSDPVLLATSVAERYWHAVPCGGQITVRAEAPLVAGLEPSTDGWVTFESSLGQNDLEAPAASYTQCTISLARWQWPTPAAMTRDWNMFCLTVVHETGHLLGHHHSLAPGSVMAPVFTSEADVPRICRTTRPAAADSARPSTHR